ncbi:MAG TPA: hypothetical protein VIP09_03790 [Dehalococcoidia bacterium]
MDDKASTIDLTGLSLMLDELDKSALTGEYGPDELSELFIDTWIPYMECDRKCGRSDYCKYTQPDPYGRPSRLAEIRCGVASEIIRNYVSGVFGILKQRSPEELQAWLDASYSFVQFVYGTEIHIGRMLWKDHLDWWGTDENRAAFFGWTGQLRKHLDHFASQLQAIPEFSTGSCKILTEGASEKAFVERLKRTRLLWFLHLDIDSYYGAGNRQPTKLLALANQLKKQGYRLFLQGDNDGQVRDIFDQLVKQGIVHVDETFSFKIDFESAFDPEHLYAALSSMGAIGTLTLQDFIARVASRPADSSVVGVINGILGVEVNKVQLAEELADLLIAKWFWTDENFWTTEIGAFLDKIRRLPV